MPANFSKITPKEVRQIRMAYDGHVPIEGLDDMPKMKDLADHFGLHTATIGNICRGRLWPNVNPPKCKRVHVPTGRKKGPLPTLRKLTPEAEQEVKQRRGKGETYKHLATEYDVSIRTIHNIVRR